MKAITIIFLALLLLNATALWSETLQVYTVDTHGRPLPNAQVDIVYQQHSFTQLDGEILATSDSNGLYSVTLLNDVPSQFELNTIKISSTYKGVSNSTTIQHSSGSGSVTGISMTLPIFELRVKLLDANNNTISNGAVRVMSNLAYTDSIGLASFRLPAGSYQVTGKYQQTQERSLSTQLSSDADIDMQLPVYNVVIKIMDQYGSPLKATVSGNNIISFTDRNGQVTIPQFPFTETTMLVSPDSYPPRNLTINTGNGAFYALTIDTEAPVISNIHVSGNYTQQRTISVEITKNGNYSSGLKSASVLYSIDNGTTWNATNLYPTSYKDFQATLPAQKANTTVMYYVTAEDNSGNKAQSEIYTYDSYEQKTQSGVSLGFNADFIFWPVAIIIILVIIFLAYKKYQGEL